MAKENELLLETDCKWVRALDENGNSIRIAKEDLLPKDYKKVFVYKPTLSGSNGDYIILKKGETQPDQVNNTIRILIKGSSSHLNTLIEIKVYIGYTWSPNYPIVTRLTGWKERTDNGIVEVKIGRVSGITGTYIIIKLDSSTNPSSISLVESEAELSIRNVGSTLPSDYIGGSTTLVNNVNTLFIGSNVVG